MRNIKLPETPVRDEIVEFARQWVGTKYMHQHKAIGHGVDCVGLIVGVGQELNLLPDDVELPPYSRTPNPDVMGVYIARYLVKKSSVMYRVEAMPDGSIVWFQWREGLPMHLGIKATFNGRPTLIHSDATFGKCVEHEFSPDWVARGVSVWDYPGV